MQKIYIKQGAPTHRESSMVKEIQSFIQKKQEKDPNYAVETVSSYDELKELYDRISIESEEIDFEEVPQNQSTTDTSETKEVKAPEPTKESPKNPKEVIDPLNKQEPIVRNYVLQNEFPTAQQRQDQASNRTEFNEPTTFEESFSMPDDSMDSDSKTFQEGQQNQNGGPKDAKSSQPGNNNSNKDGQRTKISQTQPGDISPDKKRRNARKNARFGINVLLSTAEVFIGNMLTKDISEAKLVEYEVTGEINMGLGLAMPDGGEQTVKGYLSTVREEIKRLLETPEPEKAELIEDATEVLIEKDLVLTPTQQFVATLVGVMISRVKDVYPIYASTKAVLGQLKAVNAENYAAYKETVGSNPPPPPPPPPAPHTESPAQQHTEPPVSDYITEEKKREAPEPVIIRKDPPPPASKLDIIIDEPKETLE